MGKLTCAVLVVVAFVLGVFVGRLPIASLILGSAGSTSGVSSKTDTPAANTAEGGTAVPTSNLSEGQKRLLTTLGIDANNITITPAMIACAEAKVGAARVDEIANGATPSFSEGLSLLACYK